MAQLTTDYLVAGAGASALAFADCLLSETEATITDSLSELEDQMTLLVVAHRLSTVQHADTVFVIDEGKIVAAGKLRDLEQDVPLVKKYIALMSFDD